MKKHFSFLALVLLLSQTFSAQTTSGKLYFDQGKILNVQMDIKASVAQQAMGKVIDFNVDGLAMHNFKVTKTNHDNTTLQHNAIKVGFSFDGMGQKKSFDSDNEKDMQGPFSETVRDMLSKTFEMVIDSNGKVLAINPEKMAAAPVDDRLTMVFNILKDITDVVYPRKIGENSFFRVLPGKTIKKGETWLESGQDESGKFSTEYTLTDITDSTIIISFKGTSVTTTKATMMGQETSTTMNSTNSGKIILDKATRIIKEKTTTTESNGSTEALGSTMPVTSKTTIVVQVKPE